MSEATMMYRNAHVYPKVYGDITKENFENRVFNMVDMCNEAFTAKKQLELIKWLSRRYIEISNYDAENGRMYNIKPTVGDFATSLNYDFSECIAGCINQLWQDLTEQERTQIAEILRG